METSLTMPINHDENNDKVRDVTYTKFTKQQNWKSNESRLEIFKRKLQVQNYFEESDDINIIYPSTK